MVTFPAEYFAGDSFFAAVVEIEAVILYFLSCFFGRHCGILVSQKGKRTQGGEFRDGKTADADCAADGKAAAVSGLYEEAGAVAGRRGRQSSRLRKKMKVTSIYKVTEFRAGMARNFVFCVKFQHESL